ncbi:hypothetical protein HY212_07715 [Candidatus Pacearchaeota archaeon]|nr:hypothetical protein [Candidatus Pacearchaeota archaeon]
MGRQYNGSPLDLFRLKFGQKSRIGRWELSLMDPGFYKALIRYHQLDQAIPEVRAGYQKGHAGRHGPSPGIVKCILKAYEAFGASATEAEKHLPVSDKTIIKIWRNNNLPIREARCRLKVP